MNNKTKLKDNDRSHRLRNQKKIIKAKRRSIIVKYVRYNTRNIIYRNKKSFDKKRDKYDRKFNCKEDQNVRESKGAVWICEFTVRRW